MKQSHLFTKTRKEGPKDEVAKNATLLIKGGFINKEMAGVYSYLPLGLRVLRKIEQIIREEMNAIGGQELLMSSFHPKESWQKTNRWDSMADLYKVTDLSGREVALGPTHEEIVVPLAAQFINSYKDLPVAVYQFQDKFRMELRAKSGILRGREFIMKDLYSFHADEKDLEVFYDKAKAAYARIFERVGIGELIYFTFASGGTFSKYSHEFQAITEAGEDTIYIDEKRKMAVNHEVFTDEVLKDLKLSKKSLIEKKAIEVGNIFNLGTRFSKPFNLTFLNEKGERQLVLMGCYGIGLGRLMGTIVEILSDKSGIVWPRAVAPFDLHLIALGKPDSPVFIEADKLYQKLTSLGLEVLFDDRDKRPGEKFADADLLGIPLRAVVSDKTINNGKIEVKERTKEVIHHLNEEALISLSRRH